MTYTPMPTVPATPDAAWGQQINDDAHWDRQPRSAQAGLYPAVTDLVRLDEADELTAVVYEGSECTMSVYSRFTALLVAP